jgi:hypothetical protein
VRRRWILGAVSVAVLIVVGVLAWVGIRAYLAKGELEAAMPLATKVRSQIMKADGQGALESGQALTVHANNAAALTGDPVWRIVEFVPVLGKNLQVMRELTEATDDVAQRAILPLTQMAGTLSLDSFKPVDGRIDVQPMLDAQQDVSLAANAITHAKTKVDDIDADGVISPLSDARVKLSGLLDEASVSIDAIDGAAQLIPAMLGNDGPRDYLVLFQNNAELRSTGGIPGAMALVHTDGGSMALTQQSAASDFPRFSPPVLDLPVETKALYGDNTAQYMQDVNFTPQFALSGQLAREMWKRQFGVEVDGVISVDPVALSYLLKATGPIVLPSGDEINSDNAVQLLLQDVYARYQAPADQNAFFASAAAAVFDRMTRGNVNTSKLVAALAEAGAERRVLIWSSHEEDQAVLSDSTLSGALPVSDDETQAFGLYFNDATAAKMDPYLKIDVATAQAVCRNDRLPNYSIRVTLTNTAPADAAAVLPAYVTGDGGSGVPPGGIRTNVALYGAPGTFNLGVLRDGQAAQYHPASDSGYTLSKLQVELAPGESTVLDFQFLGGDAQPKKMVVEHTPLVYSLETSNVDLGCENALQ